MKIYGLIGNPLGHSFSKKYFTEKFEKEGITDSRFDLFPLDNIAQFPGLLYSGNNIKGLAVTIPFKENVIPYLDHLDKVAREIGAVNCVGISGKILTGYNSDCIGFERSLVPLLQSHHKHALVMGSGGSSKAVQYVLNKLGISFLIVSRNPNLQNNVVSYDSIDKNIVQHYSLIINCTPVGMYPIVDEQPQLPYEALGKDNLLFDLVYSPEQTKFLTTGLEQGATIKNGYEMLVIQAEANWRIWGGDF